MYARAKRNPIIHRPQSQCSPRLRVSRICREITFDAGEVLVWEGDTGDTLYVIVQGDVQVANHPPQLSSTVTGDAITTASLGKGT